MGSEARLWTGGRIYTGKRTTEALLVEDGLVVAAGPERSVLPIASTGTERVDLGGRSIIPGLIDAHVHLTEIARQSEGLDLSAITSANDLVAAVGRWWADRRGQAVAGRGWDPEKWGGGRWPDRTMLDRQVSDTAVVLYHASGHAALVNAVALAAIGLDPSGPAPDEPTVGRFPDGRPNGLLYEEAMGPLGPLAVDAVPVGPRELSRVAVALSQMGITAVGSMSTPLGELDALRSLDAAGDLPLTVRGYIRLAQRRSLSRFDREPPDARVAVAGVKLFLDGAFGPRTAWLSEAYADDPGTVGIPVGDESDLQREMGEFRVEGLSPALHAIGDRAVGRALRLLATTGGGEATPCRIEHAGLVPPELLAAFGRQRPMTVVQPGFVWSDGWLEARLGRPRARWAYPFRTLLERGVPLAGSSDAPFDPVDPWRGIRAAVARRGPDGRSANPSVAEAVTPEQALALYTGGAATAIGLTGHGSLEAGSIADLVVLDAPTLEAAIARPGSPVRETWVSGRLVASSGGRATA